MGPEERRGSRRETAEEGKAVGRRGPHLNSDELVVNHDLLGQEISTNGGLVLAAEALVDVLVHE